MLTAITYNCNPDSLGDVTPEAFVDAFENEVYATPHRRNVSIRVTFYDSPSGVTSATDDTDGDPASYHEEFTRYAERAWRSCLTDAA